MMWPAGVLLFGASALLNEKVGTLVDLQCGPAIRTRPDALGHAVYGPYERIEAGQYEVSFVIRLAEPAPAACDPLCAIIDVALDSGARSISYDFVFASQLDRDFTRVTLPFELDRAAQAEFRVFVGGSISIEVLDAPALSPLAEGRPSAAVSPWDIPLLVRRRPMAKYLYENGARLVRVGTSLRATLDGITFHANDYDDVNFIDELFWKKAYNFRSGAETCVVDVGMNVGLASLLFAAKPEVREVHSFEPFPETFDRGMANLALNPTLADRIFPRRLGLGDGDEDATFLVEDTHGDSGMRSTRSVDGGTPVVLSIRDAGATLGPILVAAGERGLKRVVKIDCEGAEFAIFQSLSRAGLWGEIDVLIVEWHRVYAGRTQEELFRPLFDAGFIVIDLTPPINNGFFYAFRAA
jgi:FkbM family methyltransferase